MKRTTDEGVAVRVLPADVLTPISAYRALANPQASCLLESVESGGRISRYSFIGIDYSDAAEFAADAELYPRVRQFVAEHRIGSERGALGGALLAFSYDAARPDARLPAKAPSDPLMPGAFVAIPATWLIFDHFTDSLTIWTSGGDAQKLERRIDGYVDRLWGRRPLFPAAAACERRNRAVARPRPLPRARRRGEARDLRRRRLPAAAGHPVRRALEGEAFDLYRALRRHNPSPYMFYVDTQFGQLLGASPEFLVRLEGRRARLRPLAGTRTRGGNDEEDARIALELLSNEKERAEHVMLVDLGRNDLGSVCEYGSVTVDELLQIERYSHVMHIVSNVVGRLRADRDALDLFRAGFPAGTVTGTPKVRAMQLIDMLEPVTRGFYAGSIGRWSFGGDFDSCITLRSIHVQNGRAWWQASAGIVADSDPVAEYDEILHKTRIARAVLGAGP